MLRFEIGGKKNHEMTKTLPVGYELLHSDLVPIDTIFQANPNGFLCFKYCDGLITIKVIKLILLVCRLIETVHEKIEFIMKNEWGGIIGLVQRPDSHPHHLSLAMTADRY